MFELKSIRLYRTPDPDNPEGLIGEIHLNNVYGLSLSFHHNGTVPMEDALAMLAVSRALLEDRDFMDASYMKKTS